MALWEMMIGEGKRPPSFTFTLLSVALVLAFVPVAKRLLWTSGVDSTARQIDIFLYYVPLVVVIMIALSIISLRWSGSAADRFQKMTRFFWAFCYVSLAVPMVVRLGEWEAVFPESGIRGGDLLLMLFVTVWIGDSAAMLIGNRIGKTQLAPSISPKKTVEGLIGGLVLSVIAGTIVAQLRVQPLGLGMGIAAALVISVFGQFGDLVESIWKRSIGTKESSHLIPGHGGVLDRFDSLFFAAPAFYLLLVLLYQ